MRFPITIIIVNFTRCDNLKTLIKKFKGQGKGEKLLLMTGWRMQVPQARKILISTAQCG